LGWYSSPPFHIAFHLKKKHSSKWIRLTFLVGSPKKRKKKGKKKKQRGVVDGHDKEVKRV
jgi:hypothetical protein